MEIWKIFSNSYILKQYWINTLKDLFLFLPKSYENRNVKSLNELVFDWSIQTVKWKLFEKFKRETKKWKDLIILSFMDEWWNIFYCNFFVNYALNINLWDYYVVWKPDYYKWKIIFWHPKILKDIEPWIIPIYPDIWIRSTTIRKKIKEYIDKVDEYFPEYINKELIEKYDLLPLNTSIKEIHFPKSQENLVKARKRLNLEKLIDFINTIKKFKREYEIKKQVDSTPNRDLIRNYLTTLPFNLTKAQKIALKEIIDDFHKPKPMLRMLQWDVWSWKTIVALIASYYIVKNFWQQVVLLAPTEILASQHYENFLKRLPWIRVWLLVWSIPKSKKDLIKYSLKHHTIDIVIWTHALIQEDIDFKNLWLVVIDEQHKFWVNQRSFFMKFNNPHILQMTATPIPRSMALVLFWEFDISIINELPPWRKPVITKVISFSEYKNIINFVKSKILWGEQVYIVVPSISSDDVVSLEKEIEESKDLFKWFKIWYLHWKLNWQEKQKIMQKFKSRDYDILISTTVIEVWIDVPNANIIIIKNAERFWLAQLHQLRWRVGRWWKQWRCFLVTDTDKNRLKAMETIHDWLKLAELDLKERWSWDLLWTRQSWKTDFDISEFYDSQLLELAYQITKDVNSEFLI